MGSPDPRPDRLGPGDIAPVARFSDSMEENQPGENERCTVASNEVRTSAVSTGVGSLSVTGVTKPRYMGQIVAWISETGAQPSLFVADRYLFVARYPFESHCSDVIKHTFDRLKDPPVDHPPTPMIGHYSRRPAAVLSILNESYGSRGSPHTSAPAVSPCQWWSPPR
jgi:hypothetical protein